MNIFKQDEFEIRRILIAGVALLFVVGSLLYLRSHVGSALPAPQLDSFIALGQGLAQETAKLINDHGRVGVIIDDSYQNRKTPQSSEWKAFCDELKKHPSVKLAATEIIPAAELTLDSSLSDENFFALIKKHSDLDSLVCLVGLPIWNENKTVDLPSPFPKIIAVPGSRRPVRPYLSSGLVSVLVVPRLAGLPDPKLKPKTLREWFDLRYEVYTAKSLESLPEEVAPPAPPVFPQVSR